MKQASKTELLAFTFGMLVIVVTFGDSRIRPNIGNLDIIFGYSLWPVMDVIYPLASIAVFMTYGWLKGKANWKLNARTVLPTASYLIVLFLICVDDVSNGLNLGLELPKPYWITIMWLYPVVSLIAFFSFNRE